jgi:hypothetical protein
MGTIKGTAFTFLQLIVRAYLHWNSAGGNVAETQQGQNSCLAPSGHPGAHLVSLKWGLKGISSDGTFSNQHS